MADVSEETLQQLKDELMYYRKCLAKIRDGANERSEGDETPRCAVQAQKALLQQLDIPDNDN